MLITETVASEFFRRHLRLVTRVVEPPPHSLSLFLSSVQQGTALLNSKTKDKDDLCPEMVIGEQLRFV